MSFVAEASRAKSLVRSTTLPRAIQDFNMVRLFQIQSGDVLFASLNTPTEIFNRDLQVRFRKDVVMPVQGSYHLGASCTLRVRENNQEATRYYMGSALYNPAIQTIAAGTELHVQKISIGARELRAELADTKTRRADLEMICNNPLIREWTVTSFEIHNQGILELRTNIQRDPATVSRARLDQRQYLYHLSGSEMNGYFGSGLPGTSGIQLLIGSNPQAFARNNNRALWVGNRCQVLGEETSNNSGEYIKDSKFAFLSREVNPEKNKVRFQFRNWGYSLERVTIECAGTAPEVLAMTTSEVEADLNQAVHFYNK